jgi:S1-C subfamily serine protease
MKYFIVVSAMLLPVGLQGCLLPSLARPIELETQYQCQRAGIRVPGLESIYSSKRKAVVRLEVGSGIGTAFMVSGDGLALTAAHVVRGQRNIKAKSFDRSRYGVKVIALHPKLDLALIKLETRQSLGFVKLEPIMPRTGETVLSIGNSCNDFLAARFGKLLEVSSRPWQGLEGGLVRFNLLLAPGDSGAPVFNHNGRVIGVVRAGGDDGRGFSSFAVPTTKIAAWIARSSLAFNR